MLIAHLVEFSAPLELSNPMLYGMFNFALLKTSVSFSERSLRRPIRC